MYETEAASAAHLGPDAFEEHLERMDPDLMDLRRKVVVFPPSA